MYGLDLEVINNIKSVFKSIPEIKKAVIYGSRAKGNYKTGSDIDLTLSGENLSLQTIYKLTDKLEELYLPYKFDISIYDQIDNPDLKDHIKRVGKVFYCRGDEKDDCKGGLPEGWVWKRLGDVCEILDKQRKPITKKYREKGPFPYYGATGVLDYVKDYIFDEKLVLLGEDGAKWREFQNSAYIIMGKTWVNNHAHVLRPKRNILDDSWLKYCLNIQNLMPFVSGLTVPKLNQSNMKLIPILLPNITEQKRIVAILNEAFTAIDKAKANAEKNLANAKEIFESYLDGIFSNPGRIGLRRSLGMFVIK